MILEEAMKKILELKMRYIENGIRFEDVQFVDKDNYGYIVVLTNIPGDLHNEILEMKMKELNGKRVTKDLWVLGPFEKKRSSNQSS